ncbi:hypothetical protein V8F06_005771 [Rhypophila decipiens]
MPPESAERSPLESGVNQASSCPLSGEGVFGLSGATPKKTGSYQSWQVPKNWIVSMQEMDDEINSGAAVLFDQKEVPKVRTRYEAKIQKEMGAEPVRDSFLPREIDASTVTQDKVDPNQNKTRQFRWPTVQGCHFLLAVRSENEVSSIQGWINGPKRKYSRIPSINVILSRTISIPGNLGRKRRKTISSYYLLIYRIFCFNFTVWDSNVQSSHNVVVSSIRESLPGMGGDIDPEIVLIFTHKTQKNRTTQTMAKNRLSERYYHNHSHQT